MADPVTEAHETPRIALEVAAPETVDVGAPFALQVVVTSDLPVDLRGTAVEVRDAGSARVGGAPIDLFEDGVNETASFQIAAPTALGDYTWSVVLPAAEGDAPRGEIAEPFRFTVRAHATRMNVWDVPSAIPAGQAFRVKVGMKCSTGCDMSGREFVVENDEGRLLASGTLGDDVWKGTNGVYFCEVELTAPDGEGYTTWSVRSDSTDTDLPHDAGMAVFGVKTVPAPKHTLRVKAKDHGKGTPIEGLTVLVHPFRAVTDANGEAELNVPDGEYRLYVSGLRYYPHDSRISVTEDVSTEVELTWEERPMKIR